MTSRLMPTTEPICWDHGDHDAAGGCLMSRQVRGGGRDDGGQRQSDADAVDQPALGMLLTVMVCSASVQDRDGAKSILLDLYLRTKVRFVFADAGFAGRLLEWAQTILRATVEVVRKSADQRGFDVLPRRWTVERTLAWMTAQRRLVRYCERHPAASEAMIRWVAINTIARRIARGEPAAGQQKRAFEPST